MHKNCLTKFSTVSYRDSLRTLFRLKEIVTCLTSSLYHKQPFFVIFPTRWMCPEDHTRKCLRSNMSLYERIKHMSNNLLHSYESRTKVHLFDVVQRNVSCKVLLQVLQSKLTLRWLMSHIYGAPILDVSRSHTTTQHSR